MHFCYLQFSQKMNKKIWLYYYGTSSRIVLRSFFLGELKTPKRHFEINWPLLVKKYFVLNATESLGRKCRIQESNLSLPHTTSSSCVTGSWPVRYFRSTHCLGWAFGMWKIDMHSTFTTLLWSQKWRIGKHFHHHFYLPKKVQTRGAPSRERSATSESQGLLSSLKQQNSPPTQ